MINLGNIDKTNQVNQSVKSADKTLDDNKIDAVQNVEESKKVNEEENSSRQNKKRHSSKQSKSLKQSPIQDELELEHEMYDNHGKKQVKSQLNLKA